MFPGLVSEPVWAFQNHLTYCQFTTFLPFAAVAEKKLLAEQGELAMWQEANPWGPFIVTAVRAKACYIRNRDYIVDVDKKVKIINRTTGRVQPRTRWSDNIHQVSHLYCHCHMKHNGA